MTGYLKVGRLKIGPECGFHWRRTYFRRPWFRRIHKGFWIGPLLIWWSKDN